MGTRGFTTPNTIPEWEMIMPGPEQKDRKHGRTPTTGTNTGEWREYPDSPFDGAPPMPARTGRKKTWHPMAEEWWLTTSTLPHAKDWRPEDWFQIRILLEEYETYYTTVREKQKTTQLAEIRRREMALGIGDEGLKHKKIRYVPVDDVTSPTRSDGPQSTRAAGKVVSIRDRRAAITAAQTSSATG